MGALAGAILAVAVLFWLLPSLGWQWIRASGPVPMVAPLPPPDRGTASQGPVERPRNLILFVADGLGFAHLSASGPALHSIGETGPWDRFSQVGWQRTHSATGLLTDSAAAATALATGNES